MHFGLGFLSGELWHLPCWFDMLLYLFSIVLRLNAGKNWLYPKYLLQTSKILTCFRAIIFLSSNYFSNFNLNPGFSNCFFFLIKLLWLWEGAGYPAFVEAQFCTGRAIWTRGVAALPRDHHPDECFTAFFFCPYSWFSGSWSYWGLGWTFLIFLFFFRKL